MGYDSKLIYNGVEGRAVIPPRKNASTLPRSSPYKRRIIGFIKIIYEVLWKVNNNYSLRWNVGIYFSEIKRMFSEIMRAVKPENIVQEMILEVYFYNEHNKLREGY